MADDNKQKKTKIDLKARLGKTTMTGVGGAPVPVPTPGPSQPGSAPPPAGAGAPPAPTSSPSVRPAAPSGGGIAPPPGLSPGIPLPPFAQQQRPQAAPPPPKPSAAQQTIKVEVGEEVEHERRKANKRAILYAGLAGVLGIAMGFFVGEAKARSDRGKKAVEDAAVLEKDVKAANDKLRELSGKLKTAAEEMKGKTYPKAFAQELAGLNIPFEAANLAGKQIGTLPPNTVKRLFDFTQSVASVNETKDSLRNLLGLAQVNVEKAWKDEKEPVVNFSVVFRKDGEKMLAELVQNKEPFLFGKDWPEKLKVVRLERGPQGPKGVDKDAVRWTKGDLTGSDLVALPVDPPTVAAFSSEALIGKLTKELRDLFNRLEGSDDPNAPTALLKQGDDLANDLHKIALAK